MASAAEGNSSISKASPEVTEVFQSTQLLLSRTIVLVNLMDNELPETNQGQTSHTADRRSDATTGLKHKDVKASVREMLQEAYKKKKKKKITER